MKWKQLINNNSKKNKVCKTHNYHLSTPHVITTSVDTITMKDVPDKSCQNINPLTAEDLNKILDQSTQQEKLCTNPVLVSVDELQKVVADTIRDKVNSQELPSIISIATSVQLLMPPTVDTM